MTHPSPSQESCSEPAGLRAIGDRRHEALYGVEATRSIERGATIQGPDGALMSRAGLSVARLALALAPHARNIWVACGPGNNGGDGLVAATHLHHWAQARGGMANVVVTHWTGEPANDIRLPTDARQALEAARLAGVNFADEPPETFDLAIDALLGIGASRPVTGRMGAWLSSLRCTSSPVLCVDLPSGLQADTGALTASPQIPDFSAPGPRHTLSLLTLKPGLFTAQGRDVAGTVWLDDLGVKPSPEVPMAAWLAGRPEPACHRTMSTHASHKGSFGDVVVIGGQGVSVTGAGMTGAAVLAARAALHAGAGRVFVGLLQPSGESEVTWDPFSPELMFRRPEQLLARAMLQHAGVVCGCGGGSSVAGVLPQVLSATAKLVLDADALNAISADTSLQTLLRAREGRGCTTVITPHPLEAARLLGTDTPHVMGDRLRAAQALAERYGVLCVLKGSGTVLAARGQVPWINPTGNAALATAGTGDVLAGMVGSALALPAAINAITAWPLVAAAVFQHGWLADHWPPGAGLSASALAGQVRALS